MYTIRRKPIRVELRRIYCPACVTNHEIVARYFLKNVELEKTCKKGEQEAVLVLLPAIVKVEMKFSWKL